LISNDDFADAGERETKTKTGSSHENKKDKNNMNNMKRQIAIVATLAIAMLLCAGSASAQDWFKTGTGLGVSKARLAVPEFALRAPAPQPLEKTFHDVLWSRILRHSRSGQPELLSNPNAQPAERTEIYGLG
jgi:hypothetical protein